MAEILRALTKQPRKERLRERIGLGVRAFLLIAIAICARAGNAGTESPFVPGMPLRDALLLMERGGVTLIFTTQLVRSDMLVKSTPTSKEPREILRELVTPHGLDIAEGPGGVMIVIRRSTSESSTTTRASAGSPRSPESAPVLSQEIFVRPGYVPPLEQPAGTNWLTEDEIRSLPGLGDDVFHTLALLPGATATDVSAELHVRGARRDETQVVLDGQELYEPYHLKDFDNALSIVGASALGSVNLMTGALPVSYGDRGAAVLDMVTTTPRQRLRLTATLLGLQVDAGDTFLSGRARWFTIFRRGTSDFLGKTFDVEAPSYSDFFAKLDLGSGASQAFGVRALLSEDELNFTDPLESKHLDTEYLSGYLWLTHQGVFATRYSSDSTLSGTWMTRDRRGFEDDPERTFDVRDERDTNVFALTHSWHIQAARGHLVDAGVDYRQFDASYDYVGSRSFTTPLAKVRPDPAQSVFSLQDDFTTEHVGVYVADRIRTLPSLTLEVGARYDRHRNRRLNAAPASAGGLDSLEDTIFSPRVTGAWAFRPSSVLRFAWGRYSQSQRAYELTPQDGDARFYRAERPQQWLLGSEHVFSSASRVPLASLRVEAYRRTVKNPRPRYMNLFDAFDAFPEGQFDRVRIEPERTRSQGAELLVRGRRTEMLAWWLNYAYATARDRVGGEDVRREIDQTHTLNANVNLALRARWNLNAAWTFRTGWPTTPIELDIRPGPAGEPEIVPIVGALNSDRLPAYHRLDLRLAREWVLRQGTVGLFFDARNVYNRRNVAGRDLKLDESAELDIDPERWPGIVPSVGVSWRFW